MVNVNAALFFMHGNNQSVLPDKRLIANQSTSPIKTINAWLLYFDVIYGGRMLDRRNAEPGANLVTGDAYWVRDAPSGSWGDLAPFDMLIYVNSDDYDVLPSQELDVQGAEGAQFGTWLVFQRQIVGSPAPNAHHVPMWFDQFHQTNSDKWKGYINGPTSSADREFTTS